MGHSKGCHEVDVEIALPGFRIGIDKEACAHVAADIVDEDGDRATLPGSLQNTSRGLGIKYVGAHENRRLRSTRQGFAYDAAACFLITSNSDHLRAFGREIKGRSAA